MSLRPREPEPVPEDTARVARAAFPEGHGYLLLRDEFGPLFQDEAFRSLFATTGRPALAPWRLALVTVLQFAEGLSDRQAADAVRRCIDWKYLLALPLADPGFDASVLADFRARLLAGAAEWLLFETLLTQFRVRGLLQARGRQRTDATHVLAAVRYLNRLEAVGETLRHALNALAVVAPDWLQAWVPEAWYERYARSFEEVRLPKSTAEREALALTFGWDGVALLAAVYGPEAPAWLGEVPAVEGLRRVWVQEFYQEDLGPQGGPEGGTDGAGRERLLRWRADADRPPAPQRIVSPYDPEARLGKKRDTTWLGYKVHLTETCDPGRPHLITDVRTASALEVDSQALPAIQAALAQRQLLPAQQYADTGYLTGPTLVASAERGVDLRGPAPPDTAWQARTGGGFVSAAFTVDWAAHVAHCPGGHSSRSWQEGVERGKPVVQIYFGRENCAACTLRAQCTRADQGRRLTLRPQAEHTALQAARRREQDPGAKRDFAPRAGIEGTHSQGVRRCGLRRSRYVGTAKTQLQHLATAAGLNLVRVGDWLLGKRHAVTRQSPFLRLAPARL